MCSRPRLLPSGSRYDPGESVHGAVSVIGSLNESALHAELKRLSAPPGSAFEVQVGGYVIDAVCGGLLIEIQTRNLGAMREKLAALLPEHRVRVVLPVAHTRWLEKLHPDGRVERRKSPKRGRVEQLFSELVSAPGLFEHPNLELEVALVEEVESRRFEAGKAWRRRGWVVCGRRLERVHERVAFREPAELLTLLPPSLEEPFTTAEYAAHARLPRRLAQQAAYCLHALALVERVGKSGNAHVYRRVTRGG